MPSSSNAGSPASSSNPQAGRLRLLRDRLLLGVFLAVLVADQATKRLIAASMAHGSSAPAEGFLRLTYTTNTGAVFGLFPDYTPVLTAASVVAVGVLAYLYYALPRPGRLARVSLALLLGGAIGNLADRVLLGHVVDFIDVGPWPVFNLADASIDTGIVLLAAFFLLEGRPHRRGGTGTPIAPGGGP